MKTYKVEFIDNAINSGALKFGQFELKSGRTSPHFFNAGEFYTGSALAALGRCYASSIVDSGISLMCFLVQPTKELHWLRLPLWRCLSIMV